MVTVDIMDECEKIKQSLKADENNANTFMKHQTKVDIVKLAMKVGNVRPIALMLGLSERIIIRWKDLFSREIEEIPQNAD